MSKKTDTQVDRNKKILVAYFSYSGNTREIARQIHKKLGGDIFEIQSVKPYPEDYNSVVKQAKQELDPACRPALKTKTENIGSYDPVFIGYPNWCGTVPAPVRTFLLENDFSEKTIAPFCTHEGSALGRSAADISKFCPESTVLEGIAIRGGSVKTSQNEVDGWLRKIKIIK